MYQEILSLEVHVLWYDGTSYAFPELAAKNLCPFYRGVLSRECPLREGPMYNDIVKQRDNLNNEIGQEQEESNFTRFAVKT